MASYGGHKDVMKTLIGEGADVNVETNVSCLGFFLYYCRNIINYCAQMIVFNV